MEKHYRGFYCISGVLEFSKDGKLWESKLDIFGYHNYLQPTTSLDLWEFSQFSDFSDSEEISKIDVPIFLLEIEVKDFGDIFGSPYYAYFNETKLSSFSIQSIYDFVKKTLEKDKIKIRRVWRLTP